MFPRKPHKGFRLEIKETPSVFSCYSLCVDDDDNTHMQIITACTPLIQRSPKCCIYVKLCFAPFSGPLSWMDGSPFTYSKWVSSPQPAAACGHILRNSGFQWQAIGDCNQPMDFICQFGVYPELYSGKDAAWITLYDLAVLCPSTPPRVWKKHCVSRSQQHSAVLFRSSVNDRQWVLRSQKHTLLSIQPPCANFHTTGVRLGGCCRFH